jgi:integrase/recombinase XerD
MGLADSELQRLSRGIEKFTNKLKAKSPTNYKYVIDYFSYLQALNRNPRTIYRQMYALSVFFNLVDKDAKKITKQEMMQLISRINLLSKYKESTKDKIRVVVKQFYKHLLGDDEIFPENVRWLKSKRPKEERFKSGDLITDEEVYAMINASDSLRDKAIVSTLFDSGCRPSELLNMRVCDCDLQSIPAHISLYGKTGLRSVAVLMCVPYLAQYIESVKYKKPQDPLWTSTGHGTYKSKVISNQGLNQILKRLAAKSGVNKPVSAYLFRHSHLTSISTKIPESALRRRAGWSKSSTMASVYLHVAGREDDKLFMNANGLSDAEHEKPKPQTKICPRCKYVNGITASYCGRCGSGLDIAQIIYDDEQKKAQEVANELLADMMKDPMLKRRLAQLIASRKAAAKAEHA